MAQGGVLKKKRRNKNTSSSFTILIRQQFGGVKEEVLEEYFRVRYPVLLQGDYYDTKVDHLD